MNTMTFSAKFNKLAAKFIIDSHGRFPYIFSTRKSKFLSSLLI
jgi:hypothetical protein